MNIKGKWNRLKSILGLSLSLSKANFKLKNEGSYLGIFWYLLNPLLLFIIILYVRDAAFSSVKIEYYPIYLIVGLIGYNFFNRALGSSIESIWANSGMIKSIKVPYESLVISKILESIYSHFFEIILIIIFMIYFKVSLFGLIFYPFIFLVFLFFIFGIGFLFSVLGVYIMDFKNIWGILSQLIFFATPIFYVISKDSFLYKINLFNPLFYFLEISRNVIIYGKIPELWFILIFILFSVVIFLFGLFVFKKYKNKFAELI